MSLFLEYISNEAVDKNWKLILDKVLKKATFAEFNILYESSDLGDFMRKFKSSPQNIISEKEKFYKSGKVLRIALDDELRNYLSLKKFSEYKNSSLEDPSLYIQNEELVATISHENIIYVNLESSEIIELIDSGITIP